MPKRIRKGMNPKEQKFRGDCRSCGAEWEYLRGELSDIQFDQRENGELSQVKCPECQQYFWVYPVEK